MDRLGDLVRASCAALRPSTKSAVAPLAVVSIRQTLRGDLVDRVRAATALEQAEQIKLAATADFVEGVSATAERREPRFAGS